LERYGATNVAAAGMKRSGRPDGRPFRVEMSQNPPRFRDYLERKRNTPWRDETHGSILVLLPSDWN